MTHAITFVLCHGWGFSPLYWHTLLPLLPSNPQSILWDLGYNDGVVKAMVPPSSPCIGIGHSFGFAKLVDSTIPFHGLIGLNTFLNFPQLAEPTQSAQQVDSHNKALETTQLGKMRLGMDRCPQKTLRLFYQSCGISLSSPACLTSPNPLALASDLDVLAALDVTTVFAKRNIPTNILLYDNDPIVPQEKARAQFQGYAADIEVREGRGHCLGLTDPQTVLKAVKKLLP